MIDRHARDRLGEAIRALASGQISNDEFERRVPRSSDPAVRCVYADGVWFLYSDLWGYRLKGERRLSAEQKAEVARWVLFLKTDQAFEWPQPSGWVRMGLLAASLLSFGLAAKIYRRSYQSRGDWPVWPFISRGNYEQALKVR